MATVPFSDLYPLIRQHVKRCPQLGLDIAIRQAARRFCVLTKYRRESVAVDLVANSGFYTLVPSNAQEEVISAVAVQLNDPSNLDPQPLSPVTPEDVADQSGGDTNCWYFEVPSVLAVLQVPTADAASGLYARCILQPTKTATTLDSSLTQQYDRCIAHGAIAFLLELNRTSWYNPVMAREFDAKFMSDEGVAKASVDAQLAYLPYNSVTAIYRFG